MAEDKDELQHVFFNELVRNTAEQMKLAARVRQLELTQKILGVICVGLATALAALALVAV